MLSRFDREASEVGEAHDAFYHLSGPELVQFCRNAGFAGLAERLAADSALHYAEYRAIKRQVLLRVLSSVLRREQLEVVDKIVLAGAQFSEELSEVTSQQQASSKLLAVLRELAELSRQSEKLWSCATVAELSAARMVATILSFLPPTEPQGSRMSGDILDALRGALDDERATIEPARWVAQVAVDETRRRFPLLTVEIDLGDDRLILSFISRVAPIRLRFESRVSTPDAA